MNKTIPKQSVKIIGITFFWLIVFFIIGEIYLRKTESYAVKPGKTGGVLELLDPSQIIIETSSGRRLRPNSQAYVHKHPISHLDTHLSINSLGFRDEEFPKTKPDDEFRILVLGDSITFADYLELDDIYLKVTQNILNQTSPKKKIRIINAGVGDVGIREEMNILETQGLSIQPDIVLIEYYLNDSRPPWGFAQEIGKKGWFRQYSVLIDTIYKHLLLRNMIHQKGIDRFYWLGASSWHWDTDRNIFLRFIDASKLDWGSAWDPDSWKIFDEEYKKLQILSQKYNFKVLIVAFPVLYQAYSEFLEDFPQTTLKQKTRDYNFYYLDLLPTLRKHTDTLLFFDQAHPTIETNKLIGETLADFLLSHNVLYPFPEK